MSASQTDTEGNLGDEVSELAGCFCNMIRGKTDLSSNNLIVITSVWMSQN